MPKLRIRELAEAQRINISQLQRRADITMGTARRYWYNTKDGKEQGAPLEELNIPVLKAIADVLGVKVRDLLSEDDRLALLFAGDQPITNSRAEGEAITVVPAATMLPS